MIRWLVFVLSVFVSVGLASAEYGVAERAYSNGDIRGAIEEYERRAAEGSGDALFTLGVIYGRGVDVPRDLIASYKWLCLAAGKGTEDAARKARGLTNPLSHDQIREAEKSAKRWLDDHSQGQEFVSCYDPKKG